MVKTRSELEKIIENLENEIKEINEIKLKYENENEKLKINLKNALVNSFLSSFSFFFFVLFEFVLFRLLLQHMKK